MSSIERNSRFYDFLPVFLCGLSMPLSIFMWLGNLAASRIMHGPDYDNVVPPTRWLFSISIPMLLMLFALRRKGVNRSGAALGLVIAIIVSIASHAFFACLAAFFFSSSKATKFRGEMKRKFEKNYEYGEGLRNWIQVFCNGGMATQLALLYLLDCGSGERPIDFIHHYRSSWLGIGILSAFASCNGDTWASELGCVLSSSDPFLITTRRKVPRGTNGAVSIVGLFVSFLGGVAIGVTYYFTVRYTVDTSLMLVSPPQWPIILCGGFAGLFGSVVDSILGATLQYSGIDEHDRIVEIPGPNIRYISGFRLLDNHSVNLISSIIAGVLMPSVALRFWPQL